MTREHVVEHTQTTRIEKFRPVNPASAVAAASVQSSATLAPPLSFVTVLTNFNVGPLSVLTIVHVTFAPSATVTAFFAGSNVPPAVHDHSPVEL